jgi:hypothetical protein
VAKAGADGLWHKIVRQHRIERRPPLSGRCHRDVIMKLARGFDCSTTSEPAPFRGCASAPLQAACSDRVPSTGVRCSYTGSLSAPRQVLKDGYLSWYLPASKQWWQRTWFSGGKPSDGAINNFSLSGTNIRAAIDRLTETARAKAIGRGKHQQQIDSQSHSAEIGRSRFLRRASGLAARSYLDGIC